MSKKGFRGGKRVLLHKQKKEILYGYQAFEVGTSCFRLPKYDGRLTIRPVYATVKNFKEAHGVGAVPSKIRITIEEY